MAEKKKTTYMEEYNIMLEFQLFSIFVKTT